MKNKFLRITTGTCLAVFFLTACIKNTYKELTNQGRTFIKIMEAPENTQYFSPFNTVQKVSMFSLRKEANSSAELNTATTVKLTTNTAAITKYNADHGTTFKMLPDSLYTIANPDFVRAGNNYTVTFKPGEFAKDFNINLNGAKWNPAETYALAFAISDPGGKALSADMDTVISFLSIKNKYDGKYTATGTLVDYSTTAITGYYPWDVELRTSGPNSVKVYDMTYTHDAFHVISSGGSMSYYGAFGVEITFDPVTNKVLSVTNPWGQPASNTRSAGLDPSGINLWNESTKTLNIKYFMYQPSVITAAPNIRVSFDENFKYVGSR